MKKEIYDVIIIGGGPAGLTAGIYSARNGLKTGILSKDIGGTTNTILHLDNWPGFSGTGIELMEKFHEQLKKFDVEIILSEVKEIKKSKDNFIVKTPKEEIETKTLIIATGTDRTKLKIPGEKELIGKGVSYCVTCDAFFFKNRVVGVIGGSDCASTTALALSDIAKKVYLIYRGNELRCEEITKKKLEEKKNVEIMYNSLPTRINGKNNVEEIEIIREKKKENIKLDGVFIEVGSTPLTEFSKELNLKMSKEGYVEVNQDMETSVKGVFAAGDVTNHRLKQVVVAAGQGAIAAKSAYDYLS